MAGPPDLVPSRDLQVSSRTILELTATLMEAAFQRLGEGVILATMPRYLEEFGRRNARTIADQYVAWDASRGATSALTGLNFISRVTDTRFEMPVARRDEAVKRLHECEFQAAFSKHSEFARAMMCLLHVSVYRGHVNGLLDHPDRDGYDVELDGRILFGDAHCDFHVTSRAPRPASKDAEAPGGAEPPRSEMATLAHHFYTTMLVSFMDYLLKVLPRDDVEMMLKRVAAEVGDNLASLVHDDATPAGRDTAADMVRLILLVSGRELDPQVGDAIRVTSCLHADAIKATTEGHDPEAQRRLRGAACMLCRVTSERVAHSAWPGARLARASSIALGDEDCMFHLEPPEQDPERGDAAGPD